MKKITITIYKDNCFKYQINGIKCSNIVFKKQILQWILTSVESEAYNEKNEKKINEVKNILTELLQKEDWSRYL